MGPLSKCPEAQPIRVGGYGKVGKEAGDEERAEGWSRQEEAEGIWTEDEG